MKSIMHFIIKTFKYHFRAIMAIVFLLILTVFISLLIPLVTGNAIDNIIGENNVNYDALITNIIYLAILTLLLALLSWLSAFLTTKLVQNYQEDLRNKLFSKIDRLPVSYIDSISKGDLISRFSLDIEQIGEGINQFITLGINGIIVIISTVGFLYYTNWIVATIIVILTPLTVLVVNYIAKKNRRLLQQVARLQGELQGYSSEMFKGSMALRSMNFQDKTYALYAQKNKELNKCGADSQFYISMAGPVTRLLNYSIYATVGVVGAIIYLANPLVLSIGKITRLLAYCRRYSAPFNDISAVVNVLYTTSISLERVESILNAAEENPDEVMISDLQFNKNIEFKNVDFSYDPSVPLIKKLNIKVEKGQRVAIVGPTGAGKSTLINLLMRFYDIDSGSITVDEKNIYHMARNEYRSFFGLVLQDSWLFNGTISQNIAFSKSGATQEEIVKAAQDVYADHFINQLPQGYETLINEDGSNLSEGQKQLICIARIMLLNPKILILDEATSNIDTRTEILVQKAFNKVMQGKTSFVVAHRLSTIREADIILVINNGDVIEQGNHEQLLEQKGFYYELYNAQFEN